MTRQQFVDEVNDWWDLTDFCYDNDCSYCDDVYPEDSRDERINEYLVNMARDADCWQSLLDSLSSIETGYEYYRETDDGTWVGLDNTYDFESYKDDVLDWGDSNDIWDDDEEEPLYESPFSDDETEDDDFVTNEPISVSELMSECNSQFQQLYSDKQEKEVADDGAFEVFISDYATVSEGE